MRLIISVCVEGLAAHPGVPPWGCLSGSTHGCTTPPLLQAAGTGEPWSRMCRAPGARAGAHAETSGLERGRSCAPTCLRWNFLSSGFGKGPFQRRAPENLVKRVMKSLGEPTCICVNTVGGFWGGYDLTALFYLK